MGIVRTATVMTVSGALVLAAVLADPRPATAADPSPSPTSVLESPDILESPDPTTSPLTPLSEPLPRENTLGGVRLNERGPVVDLSADAKPLPDVQARTWVLADATTGAILASKGAHTLRRPASTLKTLTALTLLPKLDPEAVWVGTAKAQNTYGSKVGIRKGREYTIDQLFYGLMLPSGNDAAIALAQANASVPATVEEMNAVAAELQAFNTTARNPSGLDAKDQFSTAYDLTLIARAALQRDDFRRYAAAKTAEFPSPRKKRKKPITIYNQNDLIMDGYDGAVGVKTGFTSKAGRTFIGAAERDGTTLIVTLLGIGEPSDQAARKLLNWGFKNRDRIVPVGELVDPLEMSATSEIITSQQASDTAEPSPVPAQAVLTASPQTQTLSSLSPTAWGWLTVFTAVILLASVALLRRLFVRRRRRFAG